MYILWFWSVKVTVAVLVNDAVYTAVHIVLLNVVIATVVVSIVVIVAAAVVVVVAVAVVVVGGGGCRCRNIHQVSHLPH